MIRGGENGEHWWEMFIIHVTFPFTQHIKESWQKNINHFSATPGHLKYIQTEKPEQTEECVCPASIIYTT